MSSLPVRKGAIAVLGAAAGALAAAAFVGTAPIASADGNDGNTIDYAALPAPAVTYPDFTYTNEFTLGLGSTEDTWTTTYDGSGLPTTVESTITEPTGTTVYGSEDSFLTEYLTSATAGWEDQGGFAAIDTLSSSGSTDVFEPLVSIFSSF